MTSSYRPWSKFNRYTWSILDRRRQPDEQPREFDFRSDHGLAQNGFAVALDELLIRFPRRGLEWLK
jgi:hypothetical protein